MMKKATFTAAMLYLIAMLCACSGWKAPAFAAPEIQEENEAESAPQDGQTEAECDRGDWEVEPLAETMYVRVDGCKIKKGPGEKYETAGTLGLLEKLRVTGMTTDVEGTDWYRISAPRTLEKGGLPDGDYYIKAELVKM